MRRLRMGREVEADGASVPNDKKIDDKKIDDKKIDDKKIDDKKIGDKKIGDKKIGDKKIGDKKIGDKRWNRQTVVLASPGLTMARCGAARGLPF